MSKDNKDKPWYEVAADYQPALKKLSGSTSSLRNKTRAFAKLTSPKRKVTSLPGGKLKPISVNEVESPDYSDRHSVLSHFRSDSSRCSSDLNRNPVLPDIRRKAGEGSSDSVILSSSPHVQPALQLHPRVIPDWAKDEDNVVTEAGKVAPEVENMAPEVDAGSSAVRLPNVQRKYSGHSESTETPGFQREASETNFNLLEQYGRSTVQGLTEQAHGNQVVKRANKIDERATQFQERVNPASEEDRAFRDAEVQKRREDVLRYSSAVEQDKSSTGEWYYGDFSDLVPEPQSDLIVIFDKQVPKISAEMMKNLTRLLSQPIGSDAVVAQCHEDLPALTREQMKTLREMFRNCFYVTAVVECTEAPKCLTTEEFQYACQQFPHFSEIYTKSDSNGGDDPELFKLRDDYESSKGDLMAMAEVMCTAANGELLRACESGFVPLVYIPELTSASLVEAVLPEKHILRNSLGSICANLASSDEYDLGERRNLLVDDILSLYEDVGSDLMLPAVERVSNHYRFVQRVAQTTAAHFVDRPGDLGALDEAVKVSGRHPIIVVGPKQCGKSWLLAKYADEIWKRGEATPVIRFSHLEGGIARDSEASTILVDVWRQLHAISECGEEWVGYEMPLVGTIQEFASRIAKLPPFEKPVTIILDGIDMLIDEEDFYAEFIGKFKDIELPSGLAFIVSHLIPKRKELDESVYAEALKAAVEEKVPKNAVVPVHDDNKEKKDGREQENASKEAPGEVDLSEIEFLQQFHAKESLVVVNETLCEETLKVFLTKRGLADEESDKKDEGGVKKDESGVKRDEGGVKTDEGEVSGGVKHDEGGVKKDEGGVKQDESGVKHEEGGVQKDEGGVTQEVGGVTHDEPTETEASHNVLMVTRESSQVTDQEMESTVDKGQGDDGREGSTLARSDTEVVKSGSDECKEDATTEKSEGASDETDDDVKVEDDKRSNSTLEREVLQRCHSVVAAHLLSAVLDLQESPAERRSLLLTIANDIPGHPDLPIDAAQAMAYMELNIQKKFGGAFPIYDVFYLSPSVFIDLIKESYYKKEEEPKRSMAALHLCVRLLSGLRELFFMKSVYNTGIITKMLPGQHQGYRAEPSLLESSGVVVDDPCTKGQLLNKFFYGLVKDMHDMATTGIAKLYATAMAIVFIPPVDLAQFFLTLIRTLDASSNQKRSFRDQFLEEAFLIATTTGDVSLEDVIDSFKGGVSNESLMLGVLSSWEDLNRVGGKFHARNRKYVEHDGRLSLYPLNACYPLNTEVGRTLQEVISRDTIGSLERRTEKYQVDLCCHNGKFMMTYSIKRKALTFWSVVKGEALKIYYSSTYRVLSIWPIEGPNPVFYVVTSVLDPENKAVPAKKLWWVNEKSMTKLLNNFSRRNGHDSQLGYAVSADGSYLVFCSREGNHDIKVTVTSFTSFGFTSRTEKLKEKYNMKEFVLPMHQTTSLPLTLPEGLLHDLSEKLTSEGKAELLEPGCYGRSDTRNMEGQLWLDMDLHKSNKLIQSTLKMWEDFVTNHKELDAEAMIKKKHTSTLILKPGLNCSLDASSVHILSIRHLCLAQPSAETSGNAPTSNPCAELVIDVQSSETDHVVFRALLDATKGDVNDTVQHHEDEDESEVETNEIQTTETKNPQNVVAQKEADSLPVSLSELYFDQTKEIHVMRTLSSGPEFLLKKSDGSFALFDVETREKKPLPIQGSRHQYFDDSRLLHAYEGSELKSLYLVKTTREFLPDSERIMNTIAGKGSNEPQMEEFELLATGEPFDLTVSGERTSHCPVVIKGPYVALVAGSRIVRRCRIPQAEEYNIVGTTVTRTNVESTNDSSDPSEVTLVVECFFKAKSAERVSEESEESRRSGHILFFSLFSGRDIPVKNTDKVTVEPEDSKDSNESTTGIQMNATMGGHGDDSDISSSDGSSSLFDTSDNEVYEDRDRIFDNRSVSVDNRPLRSVSFDNTSLNSVYSG